MKNIIGLTGPTGSGKSIAANSVKDIAFVIDCDAVAREAVLKGSDGLAALTDAFGEDILTDGELNRALLAKRAFKSKENTELLNETIFPFIKKLIFKEIEKSDKDIILLDAPTLIESGLDSICNAVISVISDVKLRKNRIVSRDNLTDENAILRINAGKDNLFYIENSDAVVYNDGDVEQFKKDFLLIFKKLTEG